MERLLSCTCGRKIAVLPSQAGQEITCACGSRLSVPTLRGLSELPAVEAGQSQRVATGDGPKTWKGWRGPVISLVTAICFICGGAAIFFTLQRIGTNVYTRVTAEDEIAARNEIFDQSPIEDLTVEWNEYQNFNLVQRQRPEFFLWQLYAEEREFLAIVSGSVAGVAGLLALVIWGTARRRK